MDVASLGAAFGLSAAAGLNAWLPLFGAALAQRLDIVELAQPFDDLSGTWPASSTTSSRGTWRCRSGSSPSTGGSAL